MNSHTSQPRAPQPIKHVNCNVGISEVKWKNYTSTQALLEPQDNQANRLASQAGPEQFVSSIFRCDLDLTRSKLHTCYVCQFTE